jgi:hypothetical protein
MFYLHVSPTPTQRFDSFPYIKNGFIDLQHQKRFGRRGALQRFGRGLPLCYGLSDLNRSTRHTSVAVVVAAVQHGPVRGLSFVQRRGSQLLMDGQPARFAGANAY